MIDPWLVSWIAVAIALYATLDGRTASLVALLGGWALLPNATYPAAILGGDETVSNFHALAIPAPPWLNKATAIGAGCLVGLVATQGRTLRAAGGLRWWDAPILVWGLVPVVTTLVNGMPLRGGLEQARDLALGWGVPYLVGRTLFADPVSLTRFARGWIWAGLAALGPSLAEFVRGPFLYRVAYGFHPYRFSGSDRTVGNRPVLFFESGNQYGIWMASAAVASVWLWALGRREPWRVGPVRLPAGAIPLTLVVASVAVQSHAAIVLMVLALVPLAWTNRLGPWGKLLVTVAAAGIALAGLAAAGWIAVRSGGDPKSAARALFHGIGKSSFTWRLARVADDFPRLLQRPLLGWGRANWSGRPDGSFGDPIALSVWFHAAGMFGAVGLASCLGIFVVPLVRGVAWLRRHGGLAASGVGVAATVALFAVHVADLPMNSVLILPVLVASGGLNALGRRVATPTPAAAPVEGRADSRGNMTYRVPGFHPGG